MNYPREVLVVVGLTMGGTTAFYTYTTYMQKFLKLSVGLTDNQTTIGDARLADLRAVLQPIYGALSDRIGRKPLLIWFGVMGTLFTIPLLNSLQAREARWRVPADCGRLADRGGLHVDQRGGEGGAVSDQGARHRRRPALRATVSIFGGTAESIALWFKSIGHESWFYYYLTAVIATSLIVYASMRDTKADSAMGRHE